MVGEVSVVAGYLSRVAIDATVTYFRTDVVDSLNIFERKWSVVVIYIVGVLNSGTLQKHRSYYH